MLKRLIQKDLKSNLKSQDWCTQSKTMLCSASIDVPGLEDRKIYSTKTTMDVELSKIPSVQKLPHASSPLLY